MLDVLYNDVIVKNGFLKKYFAREVVLNFGSVDEILKSNPPMKATEQYFPVVLFICCPRRF